jgi:hypothetical protein
MADLLRIRIPQGWAVLDNKFYDSVPEIDGESDFIRNWNEGFIEDVLWMQECRYDANGGYRLPENSLFSIDLSWLPDSRVNGSYYAKLMRCEGEDTIEVESFESTNRFEVRTRIELLLDSLRHPDSAYRTNVVRAQ